MALLWRRYGAIVIAAAVLLVAVTAGIVGWQAWRDRALDRQGETFARGDALLAAGNAAEAAAAYRQIVESGAEGPADVARLLAADALLEAGREDEALATLEALAQRPEADDVLHDAAALLRALHLPEGDGDLEALAGSGRPFRHSAKELLALNALKAGETEQAITLLRDLRADALAPPALKARAGELLGALGAGPETEPSG